MQSLVLHLLWDKPLHMLLAEVPHSESAQGCFWYVDRVWSVRLGPDCRSVAGASQSY